VDAADGDEALLADRQDLAPDRVANTGQGALPSMLELCVAAVRETFEEPVFAGFEDRINRCKPEEGRRTAPCRKPRTAGFERWWKPR